MLRAKHALSLLITLKLLLFLCLYTVKANDSDRLAPYVTYLKVSGLQAQIKLIPKTLFSSLPADFFGDAKTKSKIERAFYTRTDSESWMIVVASEIANAVDASDIDELIVFYSTKLGRKLATAQEGALNTWTLQQTRQGYTRVSILTEDRLALLKGLAEKLDLESFNVEAVDAVVQGVFEGYIGQLGKLETTRDHYTLEAFRKSKKIAQARTREICLVSLANSLSPLTNQELGNLSSFLESPMSHEARSAYRKALVNVLRNAAQALGKTMREASANFGSEFRVSD